MDYGLASGGILAVDMILVILAVVIGSLVYVVPVIKRRVAEGPSFDFLEFNKKNVPLIITAGLLIVGFLLRTAFVDRLPRGLNQDEASIGYEAWSILHYGIDRNGNRLPVHLVSWGSGQNAFYAYFITPFIAIFGLNEMSIRLPMGILSCISLYLIYLLVKRTKKTGLVLTVLSFCVIAPWDIMRSRWCLESNAFPSLLVIGTFLLIVALDYERTALNGGIYKRLILLASSAVVFGLSAYSYGTSYLFLPLYLGLFLLILLWRKQITKGEIFSYVFLALLVALPIVLFVFLNLFGGKSYEFLGFTIPKLTVDRFHSVTNIFSGNFISDTLSTFFSNLSVLLTQSDGLSYNSLDFFGTIYIFSTIFTVIGLFHKSNTQEERYLLSSLRCWFIVSLVMMALVRGNINRLNFVFIPLMVLTGIGLYDVFSKLSKTPKAVGTAAYAVSFFAFLFTYTGKFNEDIGRDFHYSLGSAIRFAAAVEGYDTCYVTKSADPGYIYVLFYAQIDPNIYVETVDKTDEGSAFENVRAFDNFIFNEMPDTLEEGNVYILGDGDSVLKEQILPEYKVTCFENFWVVNTVVE